MRLGLDARLAGAGLGVSRLITALATGMPASGIEVVWFGDARLAPPGVSEVARPPGPGFAGLDLPRGRRLARALRIDLMHFPANSGWWTPGREPHVLTIHDVIWSRGAAREREPRQLFGHAYLRLVVPRSIRAAAAVSTPSATAAQALRSRYGASATVIANGVAAPWRAAGRAPGLAPEAGPPTADAYLVAFAGRDERKATDVVLDAWARVEPSGVALKLLAGAGIPRALSRRIADWQAAGRIEVLDYLSDGELVETVAGAVALLYPSRDEGFGLPVVEAMAAGVPVITGLAPVTLEVGGDAVLTLDPGDPAGSAAARIAELLEHPELRARLAAAGRARAEAFTWEAAVSAYRCVYEAALAGLTTCERGPNRI